MRSRVSLGSFVALVLVLLAVLFLFSRAARTIMAAPGAGVAGSETSAVAPADGLLPSVGDASAAPAGPGQGASVAGSAAGGALGPGALPGVKAMRDATAAHQRAVEEGLEGAD